MAFPTIPTAAAGRLLSNVQANTTAVRTFPSLTGLTKNAGDLLIAVCVAYQTTATANAAFGTWTGGFTEFVDQSSSTTMAFGAAYKWSTGSETGTFAVTQAATITGHAAMIVMSIPGAHATTPPEGGAIANGTTAAADPPAGLNPAGWDVEDVLWVAVAGSGEVSTTGSYTGIASGPANYSDYADTGISADAAGGVEGAVAFRQLNAASEDVGVFSVDVSNARNSALLIAVRPVPPPPPTTTAVGEVSLGSASDPAVDTGHSLFVRARKSSGTGTVTLSAALYEGASNRSGNLTTSALTTSLAEYELPIAEASAANITSYSNLGVRFWGDSSTGDTVNVEVAEVWLEVPALPVVALAGTSTGTSTSTGSADVHHPLTGTTAGTAATTGSSAVQYPLGATSAGTSRSGLCPGQAVPDGSVYPGVVELLVEHALAGTSAGTAVSSGDLTVDLAVVPVPVLVMAPRVAV